jgi:hypothetical protein
MEINPVMNVGELKDPNEVSATTPGRQVTSSGLLGSKTRF